MSTSTRRVRHEVADGVTLMGFAPYSLRSWGDPHFVMSVGIAALIALLLGLL